MSLVQKIGENIIVRNVKEISGEVVDFYIHSNKKIAAGVSLIKGDESLAKDISMHIAATNPLVLSRDDLDKDYVSKEREIFKSQVEGEDKPQEIIEKMVEGKLKKQLSDVSLLKQPFVKDPSKKVDDLVRENDNVVLKFFRYELGEGIEVEKMDFAEEVNSQLEK